MLPPSTARSTLTPPHPNPLPEGEGAMHHSLRPRPRSSLRSGMRRAPFPLNISFMPEPITARAAVLYRAGSPLSVEDVQVLPPRAGEVRVQMKAAGVCHSDLHVIK